MITGETEPLFNIPPIMVIIWQNVGSAGSGVDWYDIGGISGMSNVTGFSTQNPNTEGWSGSYLGWHNAKFALDSLIGKNSVRFRVLFGSNSDNSFLPILIIMRDLPSMISLLAKETGGFWLNNSRTGM